MVTVGFFARKISVIAVAAALVMFLLSATAQRANAENGVVLANGSYACATGLPTGQDDKTAYKITDGVVSDGTRCVGAVVIPEGVTSIGFGAFAGSFTLNSIILPASVKSIGGLAFAQASYLTSINIPAGMESIGTKAFYGANKLTAITLPSGVTTIGDQAFYGAIAVTSINIPDSVTSIGGWAFSHMDSLTSITLPTSLTSIGEGWFYQNYNLASITIPAGVTSIQDQAFYGASKLGSITIPAGVTSIGTQAFNWAEKLRRVYFLGDAPTFIGDHAFDTVKGVAHAHITARATGFPSPGSTWNYLVFDDAGETPAALKATYVKGATLKGSAKVNKSITVSPGTWKGYLTVFYTYQWYSCTAASNKVLTTGKPAPKCKLIKGATKASFTVSKNLKGSFLGALITGTNSVGNSTVFTATVGKVS